ncbi:DUF4198 domain-containing protein [Acidovorax sp. SUPP2522]|uniref:DUF4198 domain-containing protein n=1 Tax=unclassified Acidovorax TaxID=2684926 RepID=UPI0023490F69|nr:MULTISPECIES: DUF4198 domain-containing protein [unclassified Acidovorax]WCM99169.1 DUF4198 domain-containing protein [Acidovorax sp. GBBC 1281]GKS90521.1 DUF4198 domain-containing protein [Acidovorax sp. SUPP2539]GKT00150.1 DUF4198 domain-containing protein [Acidovorax sp. SUPP3434]GKT15877.1 DUF4198 domain-containing protein [Acidovorax sp. SUPP2522]
MSTLLKPITAAVLSALAATAVQAHQVWIEASGAQARVQFGEYADGLLEKSPGALDKFKGVPVLEQQQPRGGEARRIEGQRTATAFTYALPAPADTLFAEAPYPLIDRTKAGQPPLLWRPAARWVASLAQPVAATAPLDVVPTGKAGELRVVFNGKPLPKAQVTLVSPSGWAREAATNAEGTVHFELPWKGQYVAEVKHSDKQPGEHAGEKYGEASYLTTLTFVQAAGMESPPLPAPAAH